MATVISDRDVPAAMVRVEPKLGALTGFAAVAAWTILYLVAALQTPYYSITGNALSDLGNPHAPAPWAFNAGNIVAGVLFLPFAWALRAGLTKWIGLVGSSILTLDAAFLILVGVFPEGSPYDLHFTFSALFFIGIMVVISHYAVSMWKSPTYGKLSGSLAVFASSLALLLVIVEVLERGLRVDLGGSATMNVLEHATVYAALGWAAWNAWRLWLTARPAAAPPA